MQYMVGVVEVFNHLLGISRVLLFDRTRKYWRWWILVRTTNRSPAKHSAQASVSWCYWALHVEYPVYQEGVIDRETRFFGPREMSR